MRNDVGLRWLERAVVLTVASFFITGCAGGGGNSAASPADPAAVSGVPGSTSPPSATQAPSNTAPDAAVKHAPTLSGTPPTSVVIDTEYSFQFAANDADGDALTLTVQNLPRWAQFDAETQRLSGTPAAGDTGTYSNITISASDGNSTVTMPAFAIQVIPTAMGQVTVSWQAPSTNTDGSALTDLVGYNIYFGSSSDNLNRSVRVDNAGLSSYVIDNLVPATYFFAITAINRTGTESARSTQVSKTL